MNYDKLKQNINEGDCDRMINKRLTSIKEIIPHRDPFIFIDRVLELSETSIVCQKRINRNDCYLVFKEGKDYFVSQVTLFECILQSAAYLLGMNPPNLEKENNHQKYYIGSPYVNIFETPELGDNLHIQVNISKRLGKKVRLQGKILRELKVLLDGVFIVTEK